jgi:hypothetical protein
VRVTPGRPAQDLCADNVVIDNVAPMRVKIIDFGRARVCHPGSTVQGG